MNKIRIENLHKAEVRPRAQAVIPVANGTVTVEAELEVPGGHAGLVQKAGFEMVHTAPPGTRIDWTLSLLPLGKDRGGAYRPLLR